MNQHLNNLDPFFGLDWEKMDGNILVVIQEDLTNEIIGYGTMTKRGLACSLVCEQCRVPWGSSFLLGNPVEIVQIRKDCDSDTLLFRVRLLFSDFEPFRLTRYYSEALVAFKTMDEKALIAAVVQDITTKDVLMVGVMNTDAIGKTLETGFVTLWSRTRSELWTKGETSGNYLKMKGFLMSPLHCSVVLEVEPIGPTCHTGTTTCFQEIDGSPRIYRRSIFK